ncbi:MAG: DUF4956 domain-containing protein [Lachnospiraceae bacterium]|nr:DUF4956 domain-containing protein [Lachnospiraceae bacterium]
MNLSQMLQRTFLKGYASMDLQVAEVLLCILVTALIAAYIFFVYKKINKSSFYNKNFNLSLMALAIIIAAIILTIQSNIVVSLGMVGALSIVRFRTAIKDPMDLVFLFWAISVGIICGAGFSVIAVIASIVVSIVIFFFSKLPSSKGMVVLLVNSSTYENEEAILAVVQEFCNAYKVKARNLTREHLDMAIEIDAMEQGKLVRRLMELPDITSASIVSHEGDVTA